MHRLSYLVRGTAWGGVLWFLIGGSRAKFSITYKIYMLQCPSYILFLFAIIIRARSIFQLIQCKTTW